MTAHVAPRQLDHGRGAIERPRRRDAVVQQRVGELLPAPRSAADHGLELGVHHDVGEAQPAGADPAARERRGELRPGLPVPAGESAREDVVGARERPWVELDQSIHRPIADVHARPRERQDPPEIGRRDEVPGGPQDVRPQDAPGVERLVNQGF